MTKIDIFSGFLGAGKTTLIKKLLKEAYIGEKVVLIENEFGEIGIDGGFLQDAGIEITEMNSGCICCSLVGDFGKALHEVLEKFRPDRILIEPSGVGKLSDVARAVGAVLSSDVAIGCAVAVVDASKCRVYAKNFGEFYIDQLENANAIILSRTSGMSEEKIAAAVALVREKNAEAALITTPWDELNGAQMLTAMEGGDTLAAALEALAHEHHHDHGEECDDPDCECHHHHLHEHEKHECCCHHHEHEHEHEQHHHDHECECHHHEHHHHEHGEHECGCHHHDNEHHHEHHHHHHADEVFASVGIETAKAFTKAELEGILSAFDSGEYGAVLRAKGIVRGEGGIWYHFDYVPEEKNIREGGAEVIGRICVIGAGIDEGKIKELIG